MTTQHSPAQRNHSDWASSIIAPAAAGLATACAASALTGVIRGWTWLSYVIVAVVLVACTGLALRSVRAPALVVGLAQLLVLLFLITGMFTEQGILAVIPGPAALTELTEVLTAAGEDIRTGAPPVEPTAPILCLATIGIGLIAVLVDTIAVAVAAPAAAGLVLLCLYAVPASLADEMLPWWTFVLGAATFTVLIAIDSAHRHRRWQGRTGQPDRANTMVSAPAAVVSVALVLGLLAGASFTAIGTVGQLPFDGRGKGSAITGGYALQPFTKLRGLLTDQGNAELFRARGLGRKKELLRAFTLDTYAPNEGWRLAPDPMRAGVAANGPLPRAPGDNSGEASTVQIVPMNWQDVWLPTYGSPREIKGINSKWYYDSISGIVYSERAQRPSTYTLSTSLEEPTREELERARPDNGDIPDIYTSVESVDPKVRALTKEIVRGQSTTFGKATALWQYFTAEGNFVYDTETAAGDDVDTDALTHFLLEGRRGYCSQFASAMAVMLRAEGIAARVAIGFTSGKRVGGYRSITSQDAHAWVEVYFGEKYGWVSFDPTPLEDGRGAVPPYLEQDDPNTDPAEPTEAEPTEETTAPPESPEQPENQDNLDKPGSETLNLAQAPTWVRWSTLFIIFLAGAMTATTVAVARRTSELRRRPAPATPDPERQRLSIARRWLPVATAGGWILSIGLLGWMVSWLLAIALLVIGCVVAAPAMLRENNRGSRLHDITMSRPAAAHAAWRELLDELADRGTPVRESETVRDTANRLAETHDLDEDGRGHLAAVVAVLEQSWYSATGEADADAEFTASFEGLRQALNRSAPLTWRGRLLPTSVLKR
ncbi:MAG: DUF4129 domain-containing protein [Actinophytocola sp.]|nr:DUF4129 domain-containing protein [Actinophytocola sp.]